MTVALWGSFLLWCLLGYQFQTRVLLADLPGCDGWTSALFSAFFAVCCIVLELPVLHLLGHLSHEASAQSWAAGLRAILVICTVVLPFLISWRISSGVVTKPIAAGLAVAAVLCARYLFWTIAAHLPGVPPPSVDDPPLSISQGVARMAVIGLALLAMLVGHGTVLAPYTLIGRFARAVTDHHVASADAQLRQCLDLLALKKKKLLVLRSRQKSLGGSGRRGAQGWLSWVTSAVGLGGEAGALGVEVKVTGDEVVALERLSRELVTQGVVLREERARARERHTLVGLCKSVLGYSFALYCVFRLWTAFDSAVRRNPTRSDPVAALVGLAMWALSGGRVHVSKAALRQVVTVVFVVTVLGNSLRAFVQQLLRAFAFLPGSVDSSIVSLVFSDILCFYSAASTLLILERLPDQHQEVIKRVIGGGMEFEFFNRWFNGLFFACAVLSLVGLYASHRSRRAAAKEAQAFLL